MKTDTVKGFQDFTGEEALKRTEIKQLIGDTFLSYGFEPAETPIVEYEEFVKGENENDEAVSDIFKLRDKGGRELALRYEFTFQLKRIAKNKKLPYKRYSIGPVFRDEPVSSNRFRQFTQCDADVVGSDVKSEAEVLATINSIGEKLGIKSEIFIGSRKIIEGVARTIFGLEDKKQIEGLIAYLDELDKKTPAEVIKKITGDEKKSKFLKKMQLTQIKKIFAPLLNTLRDEKLDELKSYYLGVLKNRGKEKEYDNSLFKQGYDELNELIKYVGKNYGIKLRFRGYLARGLSYYNGIVFEIKTKDKKESIAAGGSYMVNSIQSTGISFGLERISMLAKIKTKENKILIVSINRDGESIKLADKLRKNGRQVVLMYDKISKALEYANSKNIGEVIIAGEREKPKFVLKDMDSGKEKKVGLKEII
jgi:histidyl-tRNA synthetase